MKSTVFTGSGVALVTPMHPDLSVNYEKLSELIEFQIQNRTDAIVITGTTGEASTLTDEEHLQVIRHTVECVHGASRWWRAPAATIPPMRWSCPAAPRSWGRMHCSW